MSATPAWRARAEGLEVRVRVIPRAGRDAIGAVKTLDDGRSVVTVRVRAAPESGAANEAVRRLIAKCLDRPPSAVRLESGATARVKIFLVQGEAAGLAERFAGLAGDGA